MTRKVAAIVSAYYAERFLEGRLHNLLSQTMVPQIVVVCQKGSAERKIAEDVLGKEATQGLSDHWIAETDDVPTLYAAWNMAIRITQSEYVTSANADDRLFPQAIRTLSSALDDNPDVGLVYPDCYIVDDLDGEPVGRFRFHEGGFEDLLNICFIGPIPMWRRSLHFEHGFFRDDLRSAGDYEFWLRLMKAGVLMAHLRQPMGKFLQRPDSLSAADDVGARETAEVRKLYSSPRATTYAKLRTG